MASIPDGYRIALARGRDPARLPGIEIEAARLFPRELIHPDLLEEGLPVEFYAAAARDQRLFVAIEEASDDAVGFAAMIELGDSGHLHEVDVLPEHGRRGLGAALVRAGIEWARGCGYPFVTLTTFREVAWNMPFYARLGFEAVEGEAMGEALARQFAKEAEDGLDPTTRVAMRFRC